MKKYKMIDQNYRNSGLAYRSMFEFNGANLVDAIKSNFKDMLNASSYYSKPFEYPITVTITPPKKNIVHSTKQGVTVHLEWMWATHTNRPKSEQEHSFFVEIEDKADIPEDIETFVILGN